MRDYGDGISITMQSSKIVMFFDSDAAMDFASGSVEPAKMHMRDFIEGLITSFERGWVAGGGTLPVKFGLEDE